MPHQHRLVFVYSVAHFIVDFACAFLMFRLVYDSEQWKFCFLVYNFCAFALQMPFGLLADQWNQNARCATLGCGLIALSIGVALFGISLKDINVIILVTILAGIGNGLFHVGGGIDILNSSKEKPTLLGIFVSPGALGLYLGSIFGKTGGVPELMVFFMLIIIGALIFFLSGAFRKSYDSNNEPISFPRLESSNLVITISALFLVVCLRSYIGLILKFDWKSKEIWNILFISFVVLGKMAGGFVAAKLGLMKASVISLGLATICFIFSTNPMAGIAAIFFFNMTMPITLWAIARIFFYCKGFSFGILTFGLFIGYLPVFLGYDGIFTSSIGYSIAALLSLLLLMRGLRKVVV